MFRAFIAPALVFCLGGVFVQSSRAEPKDSAFASLRVQESVSTGAGAQQEGAPIERQVPPASLSNPANRRPNSEPAGSIGFHGGRGEHLAQWLNQHQGMTLEQQERALEQEPGFQELPTPTQQRMRGRLAQLNEMSPTQRKRIIERTEAMERLTLPQRLQVRGAMQQLSLLPLEERKAVSRSFRELRQLPPSQRMAAMYNLRYSSLNLAQRAALTRLLQVAPMLPQQ